MIHGNLKIINIACVMNPDDAHKACFKQKTNLQRLELVWRRSGVVGFEKEVNVENEVAVLDGLEPPSRIRVLEMHGYAGGRYARWMLNQIGVGIKRIIQFPCLTVMKICGF